MIGALGAMAQGLDPSLLFGTILDILGLACPPEMGGKSLIDN